MILTPSPTFKITLIRKSCLLNRNIAIQFAEYNSLKNKVAREHQLAKLEEERNKFYESKVTLEDQVKTGDNDHTEYYILLMISQDDIAVI